jgi:hypothetical protein
MKRRRPWHAQPVGRIKARAVLLFELGGKLLVGDVPILHLRVRTFQRAVACTDGAAAFLRDNQKRRQYRRQGPRGTCLCP